MSRLVASSCLAALALVAMPSAAQDATALQTATGLTAGDLFGATVAGVGDVDGDGAEDWAGADGRHGVGQSVRLRVFSGATGAPLVTVTGTNGIFGSPQFAREVRPIGDVDGDLLADLLVGSVSGIGAGTTDTIDVYSGGSGALIHTNSGYFGVLGLLAFASIPDRDGDGVRDFAHGVDIPSAPAPMLMIRSGATGSLITTLPLGVVPTDVMPLVDLDGDGVTDLICSFELDPAGTWLRTISGATGAVIWSRPAAPTASLRPLGLAGLDDIDGDGIPDLAGVRSINNASPTAMLLSGATGATLATAAVPGNVIYRGVTGLHDVDGDGRRDLAVATWTTGYQITVSVLSGATAGLLYQLSALPGSGAPLMGFEQSLAALPDISRDGSGELVIGSRTDGSGGRVEVVALGPALLDPCAASQVAGSGASPADVLTVDGGTGGTTRCVHLPAGSPFTLRMDAPPTATAPAPFALWGRVSEPTAADLFPTGIGPFCFAPASAFPGLGGHFTVANSFGPDPTALVPGAGPAPFGLAVPVAPGLRLRLAFEGLILDAAGLARTNAVIVELR